MACSVETQNGPTKYPNLLTSIAIVSAHPGLIKDLVVTGKLPFGDQPYLQLLTASSVCLLAFPRGPGQWTSSSKDGMSTKDLDRQSIDHSGKKRGRTSSSIECA